MFGKYLLLKVVSVLVLSTNLVANSDAMPTVFIGTYSAQNQDTIQNLILPNTPSGVDDGNWNLTHLTQELLRNDFKNKLGENKFNLVLMKEFSDNLKDIVGNKDISDKKIGFLNVDTFQNIDHLSSGEELIIVTLSLIFAQIGEEANRESENNNFEVRYTNGITVNGVLEIEPNDTNRDAKIQAAYKKFYKQALGDLLDLIAQDTKAKQVTSFSSDDMFFTIGNINLGKRAKELAFDVYGDEELAKKQIMMILQENLIKEIRQDKSLDDIVLLYPDKLNEIIVNNWGAYLKRMNEVSFDGAKNNDASVLVRKIKPSCVEKENSSRNIYLDGYTLEVYVSDLYDKFIEEGDVDSVHVIKVSMIGRIVISVTKKKKIDAMSVPFAVIKKKKTVVAQASDGYTLENSLSSIRKNKTAKTIRKVVSKLSPKLVSLIKDIVKERKNALIFEYKDFCEE
ncbi:hypothetical protein JHD48_05815 [Sulfurimonas sp. SAG-AH-194-I05]|nr:hypothetical protein [Sulfurimonas sp. SAG-AH-194-I05]MDF1875242.1 hypothetical protein [Sulfurimonas sp. SAG-AH-194-I05]